MDTVMRPQSPETFFLALFIGQRDPGFLEQVNDLDRIDALVGRGA